jgi:hypothetical protein
MDTVEFLDLVLPQEGNYVLTPFKGKDVHWNEHYTNTEDLAAAIARHNKTINQLYFAVGKFVDNLEVNPATGKTRVRRLQKQAAYFKTLCCDIDVGEDEVDDKGNVKVRKHRTQKAAAKAVLDFCDAIKMPHPMLVSSGNGVHAYWPLKQTISADLWEKMSRALCAAMLEHGLVIDASKIHDRSMVLRPVGSYHKKDINNPKPVKVVYPQPARDAREYALVLSPYKDKMSAPKGSGAKKPSSAVMAAVLEGGSPIRLDDVRKCKQIDALLESGGALDASGAKVVEPLWRASLGIAKYADNVPEAVVRLCSKHPEYDFDENMRKLERWNGTGPTTCATFKKLCPEGCNGCKFENKITSPAQLTGGVTEVTVTHPVTNQPAQIKLPPRYSLKNGAVYYTPAGSDEDVFVAPYMMYVVARFTDVEESRALAKVAVMFPVEGTKLIDIDVGAIASGGSELNKALALRQVYTYGDNKHLRQYLMTYLQELQKASSIDYYYKHFGWQKDGSFLGPNGLVGRQVKGHTHFDGPIEQYADFVKAEGDLDAWLKTTKFFAHPALKHHGFIYLMFAGAPLMKGSGLASILINMYSKDSGSGKTLSARFGLSIWGKPSKLIRTVSDTDNANWKHFGIMNSFGGYIDELTTMDQERLRNAVFSLQEGRERERVKQSADGFRDKAYWNMPVMASSNRDIYEALGTRYSSEAEKLRVLQLPFDRVDVFERGGTNIGYALSKFLESNHGLLGPVIVDLIIANGGPDAVYDRAYQRFSEKYGFTFEGPERFYQAACVVADAIGELLTAAQMLPFDYEEQIRRVLRHIEYLRGTLADETMDGLDLVFQFLTENADKIVHWRQMKMATGGDRSYVIDPAPRVAYARTEVAYDEKGDLIGGFLYVNRAAFKKWCHTNGAEFRATFTNLQRQGVKVVDNVRKTIYKGVQGATASGQTYCFSLDLSSHPRLIEANDGSEPSPINVTPRLAAVV